ncbi:Mo-dependent nitrogenase C-terminal domain-containing protein [Picosynechococcus sp. NKBG042902]|uniref:Mo-dependent nitrogenase C-terminal domain-containing protein n=1 Tax=Picosynechococcus sp. NKBG042902 TaxID=490193 RepID=UPI0009076B21|nr:Mo-dependent nitrogenase C-terminal domain-containing protein [Picosynechococcus sp. NKBG042902]
MKHHPLQSVCQHLSQIEISNPITVRLICRVIPTCCPCERKINLFGVVIIEIPPLCKLNSFYEELIGLRFRALSYLADVCHEDGHRYC